MFILKYSCRNVFAFKIRKSRDIFKIIQRRQFFQVSSIELHILAKFHEEMINFDEIRGHLLILPFYRAQTRAFEGPLW